MSRFSWSVPFICWKSSSAQLVPGFSWALLTTPLFWVCFHDICMTSPRQSSVISMVWRIIKSAHRFSGNINQADPSLSLRPRSPVAYLKPCQRSAGCGMSASKHASAVASAGLSDGINRPLPSLQSNRDQGGSLGMTCEGPKPSKNTQRNTTWLSWALLHWTWGREPTSHCSQPWNRTLSHSMEDTTQTKALWIILNIRSLFFFLPDWRK